jgi:UDP-N-acetylglucosamine:LPS N-acetylglucosamine transferase
LCERLSRLSRETGLEMAQRARECAKPDAAAIVARACIEYAERA